MLYPENKQQFEQLFLNSQIYYSNLYPAFFMDDELSGYNLPVYPLPRTAQSCKRHGGFFLSNLEEKKGEEKRHGIRDNLTDWVFFHYYKQLTHHTPLQSKMLQKRLQQKCPSCDATMDHFEGYYRRNDQDPYKMVATRMHRRLNTHTGIDRESGTVQENILYNRQVFEEGMRFWGMVKLPDDEHLITPFQDFIKEANRLELIRIGTGRTRGMGKVTLDINDLDEEPDRFIAFKKRLMDLDSLLQKHINDIDNFQSLPFFAITLHSPHDFTRRVFTLPGHN